MISYRKMVILILFFFFFFRLPLTSPDTCIQVQDVLDLSKFEFYYIIFVNYYFILQTQNRDIILEVSGLPCVAQF